MKFSLNQLQQFISDQNLEASELVQILELSVTDIIRKFPREVREHQDYFIPEGCLPEEDEYE